MVSKLPNNQGIVMFASQLKKKKFSLIFKTHLEILGILDLSKSDSEWVLENGDIYIINFILKMLPKVL
jgi:hypothetical protein